MKRTLLLLLLVTLNYVRGTQEVFGAEGPVQVVVESDGSYNVVVDGEGWFGKGSAAVHVDKSWHTSTNSTLKLVSKTSIKGEEKSLGAFVGTDIVYSSGEFKFHAIIKYFKSASAYVFTQLFENGANNTALTTNGDVISAFPSFGAVNTTSPLFYLTYRETFASPSIGKWPSGFPSAPQGGSPVIFYDHKFRTVIFSPIDNFMVGSQTPSKSLRSAISFGLNGLIKEIPANFSHSTIMYFGQGINNTMHNWGSALLDIYGKTRTKQDADIIIETLGYWTDNGAYYYYLTEPNKNYQETMVDIAKYIKSIDLPVKNYQLDSWWYYKGAADGVSLWEPMPSIFPDGVNYVHEEVAEPLILHNRYFSSDNKYKSNYSFIVEGTIALPLDENLFKYIMQKAKGWGMVTYEQDWLVTTYLSMQSTQNSVSNAKKWLLAMGNAATSLGLTIQYCMPLPMHNLQSAAIQSVTQIRASGDYNPGNRQWEIGHTSQFIWSLGAIPFKDDFWTTSDQPGCKFPSCVEPNPVLETLVAALSTGPVGPSDQIGKINKELVMKTCTASGLLLKTDKPATPVDAAYLPPTGSTIPERLNVLDTYTAFGNNRWHYVSAIELKADFVFTTSDIDEKTKNFYAFNYFKAANVTTLTKFGDANPIHFGKQVNGTQASAVIPFEYYLLVPELQSGWLLLGELSKFVTVSKQRVQSVADEAGSLTVVIKGSIGEETTFSFWSTAAEAKQVHVPVKFTATTATIKCSGSTCTA